MRVKLRILSPAGAVLKEPRNEFATLNRSTAMPSASERGVLFEIRERLLGGSGLDFLNQLSRGRVRDSPESRDRLGSGEREVPARDSAAVLPVLFLDKVIAATRVMALKERL